MRKLLLVYILLFLWALPAKSTLTLSMFPDERRYALSLAHQGPTCDSDGHVTFSAYDGLVMMLPSRFKVVCGDASVSLGYTGFWQEYALLPMLAREHALLYQTKAQAMVMLPGVRGKSAIGYERASSLGAFSLLAWMHTRVEASSFQTGWGSEHAGTGFVSKASLKTIPLELGAEVLITPVKGIEVFIASTCTYGSSQVGFSYGQAPYPSRYSLSLDLRGKALQASFVMDDWLGSEPIYGGFSATRKRKQSSVVRFPLGKGYVRLSFTDTYEFKAKGGQVGSLLLQASLSGTFGQMTFQYGGSRDPSHSLFEGGAITCSLVLYKAVFSYAGEGYGITLTDSLAIGKGIGTWKLRKQMGKAVSLSISYTVTSDR